MKRLIMGNEAVAMGALEAGMTFFAAYPITPASEIMHFLAKEEGRIVFMHAEDEIASIHMAIGGSLAGNRSMTSTSGPGMSLKQEGIGLAHMMGVPMVVVNVMRVGPSTGMPTLPSQGDVLQARYGTHGDYNPIVFYPASVSECYVYIQQAFNAAEESRTPVILLLDGFLAHLAETVDLRSIRVPRKKRTLPPLGKGTRHFTGLLSKDGVPQTKDTEYYRKWYAGYKKRVERVADKYAYDSYLPHPDSETLLIAYGITSRVIRPLRKEYSIYRPIRIFPVLEERIRDITSRYKRIIVVEMNDGQYRGELQKILRRDILGVSILGGTINLREVKAKINELL
ncbi:MAG: 2-oxoacid:acceptor oxidoreductase subunit alpha [Acidobacteria bacterium]|nr:2-oxoacid:acceptor oxidoreductase subunit alpha [Acidobacteriota bacterium]